jgi:hypothetical protein
MRPKMEPKLLVQLLSTAQPNPTKVAAPIQGSASNTGKDRTEKYRNRKEKRKREFIFLLRLQGSLSSDFSCDLLTLPD